MPNVPPSKKLKQMDLLSSFQQSPKKQTARDNESGEMSQASDNVQERMDKFCKEEVKEGPSKFHMQQEGESHTFNFRYKFHKHAVTCDTSKTVLDALNTNTSFTKIKEVNLKKEIVIQRSKGEVPRAAVKTDFPCCLIEKDELLDISFIKNTGNVDTKEKTTGRVSFSNESENLVIFYIKTKGGVKVKRLMRNNKLRNKVEDVCVYAFKKDNLEAALRRDGRFTKVIFDNYECELQEFGSEIRHGMSNTVEHLDRKYFEIIVISDKKQRDSRDVLSEVIPEMNEASATDLKENTDGNQHPIKTEQEETKKGKTMKSTKYSKINDSEEILGILRSQSKDLWETVKQREELKNMSEVQSFFRTEYGKSVENFSRVKKVKELMRLSDSVCQIRVRGSPIGTGFLLFERFILTNAHVIGISTDLTKVNVAQFTAVFDYEDEDPDSPIKRIPVKELTAYSYGNIRNRGHLDYALLELDDVDKLAKYPELLSCYSPNTTINRGGICIVGHPHEGVKKMDPCIIIETGKRLEAENKHKSENKTLISLMTQKSVEEKWDFFDNQITYDSCFFHGSSGSPVFDVDCNLIGIHTGGYVYQKDKKKTWSVMEYSFTMQPILDDIRARAKIKGLKEIVEILEPYTDKSNESGAADQQNQTDHEMNVEGVSEECLKSLE